jgi:hypothetical protein
VSSKQAKIDRYREQNFDCAEIILADAHATAVKVR